MNKLKSASSPSRSPSSPYVIYCLCIWKASSSNKTWCHVRTKIRNRTRNKQGNDKRQNRVNFEPIKMAHDNQCDQRANVSVQCWVFCKYENLSNGKNDQSWFKTLPNKPSLDCHLLFKSHQIGGFRQMWSHLHHQSYFYLTKTTVNYLLAPFTEWPTWKVRTIKSIHCLSFL